MYSNHNLDTLLNMADWDKPREDYSIKPYVLTKDNYKYFYDSNEELKTIQKLSELNIYKHLRGQAFCIDYYLKGEKPKKYFPDIVMLDHNNQIVLLEVKQLTSMSYYKNIIKYEALKRYALKHDMGYVMCNSELKTFEDLKKEKIDKNIKKRFNGILYRYKSFNNKDFNSMTQSLSVKEKEKYFIEVVKIILHYRYINHDLYGFDIKGFDMLATNEEILSSEKSNPNKIISKQFLPYFLKKKTMPNNDVSEKEIYKEEQLELKKNHITENKKNAKNSDEGINSLNISEEVKLKLQELKIEKIKDFDDFFENNNIKFLESYFADKYLEIKNVLIRYNLPKKIDSFDIWALSKLLLKKINVTTTDQLLDYNKILLYYIINIYSSEMKISDRIFDDVNKILSFYNSDLLNKPESPVKSFDFFKKIYNLLFPKLNNNEIYYKYSKFQKGTAKIKVLTAKNNKLYPFPQANDVDKIIKYCDYLFDKENINIELGEFLSVTERQVNYYRDSCLFLKLIVEEGHSFRLSNNLLEIYNLNSKVKIIEYIIETIKNENILSQCYNKFNKNQLNLQEFKEILLKYYQMSETTLMRRFSTVKSWFEWITNIELSKIIKNILNSKEKKYIGIEELKEKLHNKLNRNFTYKELVSITSKSNMYLNKDFYMIFLSKSYFIEYLK